VNVSLSITSSSAQQYSLSHSLANALISLMISQYLVCVCVFDFLSQNFLMTLEIFFNSLVNKLIEGIPL